MLPFAYARATKVAEAIGSGEAPDVAFLAGGTEILNWLRLGIAAPSRMIDIARIDGLSAIEPTSRGGLRIGALARLNDAAQHPAVKRDYPVLSEAILKAASPQLRNLATIGGNPLQKTRCPYFRADEKTPCNKREPGSGCSALHGLNDNHAIFGWTEACVATQPSDPAVALAALDAVFITEHRSGGRRIPAAEFHTLPDAHPQDDNVLRHGELITAIELPAPAPHSAYVKVRERESYEYALVSAAAVLDVDGGTIRRARLALGSVAHRPWRLREAEYRLSGLAAANREAVRSVIDSAFTEARPLAHNAYKVPLAKNAALRAIMLAARPA
jgi:xanthine dehydrogenase YagS FAD-binding subunit